MQVLSRGIHTSLAARPRAYLASGLAICAALACLLALALPPWGASALPPSSWAGTGGEGIGSLFSSLRQDVGVGDSTGSTDRPAWLVSLALALGGLGWALLLVGAIVLPAVSVLLFLKVCRNAPAAVCMLVRE